LAVLAALDFLDLSESVGVALGFDFEKGLVGGLIVYDKDGYSQHNCSANLLYNCVPVYQQRFTLTNECEEVSERRDDRMEEEREEKRRKEKKEKRKTYDSL
jgi:hypothetical protein